MNVTKTKDRSYRLRLRARLERLIEPSNEIKDIQQRQQVRLLSGILLVIAVLGTLSAVVQLLTVPGFLPTFTAVIGAVIFLLIAYGFARTRYYLPAALLASVTPFIASYTGLITNPYDPAAFVYLLISVFLGSILLNRLFTLALALLNLLGLLLLPMLQPAWTLPLIFGVMSYHIIIPILILLSMSHRDRVEEERQSALLASQLQFRGVFDNSVDAIGVSKSGRHVMANPAYLQMFGYERSEQLLPLPIFQMLAPAERDRIQEFVRQRAAGENVPSLYETRGLRTDGTEFDLEAHVSSYELDGEHYTVSILRDITEHNLAKEKLKRQNQRLLVLREIDSAILAADSVERIVNAALLHIRTLTDCDRAVIALVNRPTEEVVVYSANTEGETIIPTGARFPLQVVQDLFEDLAKNRPVILKDVQTMPNLPPFFQKLTREGLRSFCILPMIAHGNQIGVFNLASSTANFFDEERVGFGREVANQVTIAILQNDLLAELRASNQELEARAREREELIAELTSKNAELERFTYTVSHDLKTPLVTMKGFLGYLEQDLRAGKFDRLTGDTTRISSAVDKMTQLLQDVLELSRVGRFVNPAAAIPFGEVVAEALELVDGRLAEYQAKVIVQPDLPHVHGDRQRLVEVVQNLLDNAAKYMGSQTQPQIEVGYAGQDDGNFLFYVKDNGMGIAPEHYERIFGLFNKLDAQSDGTGVGLALVKRIIEFHGGKIWVESVVEQGTTFYFALPPEPET